ncbi:MAG: hypothetical protein HQL49_13505 [Gammaproteobacteria bacterium]|nr:hypothetical protein [Gammaproteobacteria bacterium]
MIRNLFITLFLGWSSLTYATDSCDDYSKLTGYGIIGETSFSSGNNSTINSKGITGSGNTPTPTGSKQQIDVDFPAITPATFPATGKTDLKNSTPITAGSYNKIEFEAGKVSTLLFSGGDYAIKELIIKKKSSTPVIQLAPGNYFIETLDLGGSPTLTISPPGIVNIYIKSAFKADNQTTINGGGAVDNLIVYLYSGASFQVGNGDNSKNSALNFNGIIYSPYSNSQIQFGNNNNFQGAILSAGSVEVGNNTDFLYSSDTAAKILAAFGCSSDSTPPARPTVNTLTTGDSTPTLQGSFDTTETATLTVTVAGMTYTLGQSSELTASGNTWSLNLAITMTPGTYEVVVTASDQNGNSATDNSTNELTIQDTLPPQTPMVTPLITGDTTPTLKGSFSSADTATLTVTVAGTTYTLGQSSELTASGNNWSLNLDTLLSPGIYEVVVTASDSSGNSAFDTSSQELTIKNSSGAFANIATQISGKPAVFSLQVEDSGGAGESDCSQTVSFSHSCVNPASCNANTMSPLSATVNSSGQANVNFNYQDAGIIRIAATITITRHGESSSYVVTSNDFLVKPAGLCLQSSDPNAACLSGDASCSRFIAAGTLFPLTLKAVSWQSDSESGTDLCDNPVTANFIGSVTLGHALHAPATGTSGLLGLNSATISQNGTTTFNQSWSEVGVINLSANATYHGDTVSGTLPLVGRFTPNSFSVTTLDEGEFASHSRGWHYLGETFTFGATSPAFTITAVNAQGGTTANYRNDFLFLDSHEITLSYPATDLTATDSNGSLFPLTTLAATPTLVAHHNGTLTLTLGSDSFTYQHHYGRVEPFNSDLTITLTTIQETHDNINYSGTVTATPLLTPLRFGRALLRDAFGPLTTGVTSAIPFEVEYWQGGEFHSAGAEGTTLASSLLTATDGNHLTIISETITYGASFHITAAGSAGTFSFELNLGSSLNHLQYDWNNNGAHDDNPTASLVLGELFRGNHRFIYLQEQ